MIKRMFLFMLVNVLVVVTLSLILNFTGFGPHQLAARGWDYQGLMVFCLVWGMGGALISLGVSRMAAKWTMGVKLVDARHPLAVTVHRLASEAGLSTMPEVGVYASPELNAFATGPTRSRSLVAVSSGLLDRMSQDELEGVLGHEVAHIANGDMVTMTLLQGVINAFVMFLARVIAFAIARGDREERRGDGMTYLIVFLLELVLGFLGMLVVAWFSRWREFRADRGGARLAGKQSMINALQALRRSEPDPAAAAPSLAAFKISGPEGGFMALFRTHPPIERRIEALRTSAV